MPKCVRRTGRSSPLDAGAATPLTPNNLVALLERAFAFAILAFLLLFVGVLLHRYPVRQGLTKRTLASRM